MNISRPYYQSSYPTELGMTNFGTFWVPTINKLRLKRAAHVVAQGYLYIFRRHPNTETIKLLFHVNQFWDVGTFQ